MDLSASYSGDLSGAVYGMQHVVSLLLAEMKVRVFSTRRNKEFAISVIAFGILGEGDT